MEFHRLTRRELQFLCKRNKIPANITNMAMADALKSLEIVEGIEEYSQPKESESAQSSVESPAKSDFTSPYVPPTGGRTTRRRHVATEKPQTLQSMSRTRAMSRKTQTKNKEESIADATETPAVATQPSRRRVVVASACRKMESQLKECEEEEYKKGIPMTPVAFEVTSRRRVLKKESEVSRVYSTRRSARLAEKNVEILDDVKNEISEILESELFMKEEGENVEMNVKEISDGVHEVPKITETSLEENSKKMDGTEVSSSQNQDISDDKDESKLESNVEEKLGQNSETDDPNPEMDRCIDAGDEQLSVLYEIVSELDEERADETEPSNGGNVSMTLNESNDFEDGDVYAVEVKQDEGGEENEMNPTNDVDNGANQASEEEEPVGKTLCREIENLQIEGSEIAAEKTPENVLASTNWQLYGSESAAVDSSTHLNADFLESNGEETQDEAGDENKPNPTKDTEWGLQKSSSIDEHEHSLGKILCHEVENLPIEASEKAADEESSSDAVLKVLASIKNSPTQHLRGLESSATVQSPMLQTNADFLKEFETSGTEAEPAILIPPIFTGIDSSFTTQLKSLTPTKKSASKTSATVKKIADVSDNKENIGSCGSKLVLTKERVKIVEDIAENVDKNIVLSDLSMRQLSKMLKEKLQITNNSSQNENNGTKAISRPALQALPENRRLGNETEN